MNNTFPSPHPLIIAQTQVMLPKDAFIKVLPLSVDEKQRFRIDGLVMCSSIIALAYQQLVGFGLQTKWKGLNTKTEPDHLDMLMIQQAWSIVDHVYRLRRLMKDLEFKGDAFNRFMSVTESANSLRNRINHLNQKIPNIASSKDRSRNLFGSLTYYILGKAAGSLEQDIIMVVQHAEQNRPGERIASFVMPSELRMPIGNFALSAGGETLDLDEVILTLGPVMVRNNEAFENSIRAQVKEASAKHGIPEDELLTHLGRGVRMMVGMKMRGPDG